MTYIRKHARFAILDDIPADVWEEPEDTEPRTHVTDPERYLCVIGDEPADYHGNFWACIYTAALYQGAHVVVSAEYLLMTKIIYAGRASFASVFTDDPQPRGRRARLDWAVRHALEDARQWGDIVSEIVSINGKVLDNNEFRYCARMARQEA